MEPNIFLTSVRIDELQAFIENSIRKVLAEHLQQNSHPQKESDLISIAEATSVLNLAKPTIYALVSNSTIPYMKKGKKLYFSRSELTEWIKDGKRKTIFEKNSEVAGRLQIQSSRKRK